MPSYSRKQNDFLSEAQQEWRFWTNSLKTQFLHPIRYYTQRQPKLDNKRSLIRSFCWAAIPFAIFACLQATMAKNFVLIPLYLIIPFIGIALWSYVQQLLLDKLFERKFTFKQTLDLALTTAPAAIIAWIPTAGLVGFFVLACFWNYLGLVHQLKTNEGISLAAAALPIVIAGAATLVLGYFGVMLLYFGGPK